MAYGSPFGASPSSSAEWGYAEHPPRRDSRMVTQVKHAEYLKPAAIITIITSGQRSVFGVRGFRICESAHPLTSITLRSVWGFPGHVQSREVFESPSAHPPAEVEHSDPLPSQFSCQQASPVGPCGLRFCTFCEWFCCETQPLPHRGGRPPSARKPRKAAVSSMEEARVGDEPELPRCWPQAQCERIADLYSTRCL